VVRERRPVGYRKVRTFAGWFGLKDKQAGKRFESCESQFSEGKSHGIPLPEWYRICDGLIGRAVRLLGVLSLLFRSANRLADVAFGQLWPKGMDCLT
jgi:hypothetical protein